MKYKLLFLTPFATSNPEGKTFRNLLALIVVVLGMGFSWGQTAVPMSSQVGLTYTENFSDIVNWTNNFASGTGASRWASYPITTGGSANDGVRTTKSSATFASGSSGGVQKGTGNLIFLSTGSTATSEAVAVDFLLNFTGVNAGNLSFDWSAIDNSNGSRPTSLRVYWSTDNTTFTEINSAQILNVQSNNSGSITSIALPVALNNSATARLRFYNHAGDSSGSGNRDKISIDNITITATSPSTPTITVSSASLINFSQTSTTPSAEQTYTVSGSNLTNNVTLTPPTGFEISTTTGTGFTNSIVLTQSSGVLSGQPVTIYVRQNSSTLGAVSGNIVHTSTDATNVNIALSGSRTGTYYSKSTGNLDDLASWGLNTDGTGASPSNFTSDGAIYEIRNRSTATIGANWVVSGSNSKVVVGDGTNAVDFIIPSGYALSGTIDVSNAAELTIENTTAPTFGTFATNSTLEYNNVAVTLSTSITYRNLKLTGTGAKTFPGNTTTIAGNLILNGSSLNGGSGPFSTILLAGNLTYVGTVTPPTDTNSITLSTNGTASGTQTFTGAGNTLRWFRITTTTANTILLSTTGGSSNVLLGNATSGGLTLVDGSIFNMNGNDFQLFSGGASFNLNTTGSISTTSNTDFNLERTTSGSLGTLRFTTGFNTIGNLTLNHTGATNTLTIGNALNINGVITVTDGTLASGGNITLKSNANGTAQVAAIGSGGSITGNVTVERYIPAGKRAFRLLSPAVTTANFISGNWQGQTHITGGLGTTGLGFDATATNNPSMFTFDNQATSGSGWASIANTNNTNLIAGTGYRVLIRGNTSVDLTAPSADTMNAAVTLSATGTLRTGSITLNSSSSPSINNTNYNAGFSLVGNPYQSPIDWNAVTKTNIEPTYYAWDPNMGTTSQRGRYVSFNGSDNSVSVDGIGSSNVGQFIQPGQAFFVKNTGSGAGSLTFDEADKVATNANVFRTANLSTLTVSLYDPNELAIAGYPIDAMKAIFNTDYSNDMGLGDAIKLEASGENMAWYRNATKLAIDAAAPITSTDELAMKTIRLGANKNYTLKINTTNFDATLTPYLVDNFLNTQTEISTTQPHLATFNTTDVAASFGEDRFKIVFQNSTLGIDDFTNGLVVYPNPAKAGDSFYVQGSTAAQVTVYNVLGQHIPVQVKAQGNAQQVTPAQTLSQGIYLVSVTTEGKTQHVKWIVE